MFLLLLAAACFGCSEGPAGPTPGEVEAKKEAAAEAQRADTERQMRQVEETRRHESDEAAQRFSWVAVVAAALVTLIIGLLIGMALGLRTREDRQSQRGENPDP